MDAAHGAEFVMLDRADNGLESAMPLPTMSLLLRVDETLVGVAVRGEGALAPGGTKIVTVEAIYPEGQARLDSFREFEVWYGGAVGSGRLLARPGHDVRVQT